MAVGRPSAYRRGGRLSNAPRLADAAAAWKAASGGDGLVEVGSPHPLSDTVVQRATVKGKGQARISGGTDGSPNPSEFL